MKSRNIRRLRVYYAHRPKGYSKFPVIRLGGNYLADAGFQIGDELEVTVSERILTITKRSH